VSEDLAREDDMVYIRTSFFTPSFPEIETQLRHSVREGAIGNCGSAFNDRNRYLQNFNFCRNCVALRKSVNLKIFMGIFEIFPKKQKIKNQKKSGH